MKKDNNIIHTFVILAYKESKYLEECIKSVLNQSYKSKVLIATTTDNEFIRELASKYKLNVVVGRHTNIGGDFDFAVHSGKTPLVTVAHQDDIYDEDYAKEVVLDYQKYNDSTIIFTDYYEVRKGIKIVSNLNLVIKRILLFPLRLRFLSKYKFIKRFVLRFGNSICCPAVTFVVDNCSFDIFKSDYKCNVDWLAWERLSKLKGRFIYNKKKLMGHRISEESTTTSIINDGIRTNEDFSIYSMFWPKFIAKLLAGIYKNSEKSNKIKR